MTDALVGERRRSLSSYVPTYVLRALAGPDPPQPPYTARLDGAVLLGDVRGFTRMTEQMAARGPEGVETFSAAMNRYFGAMIDLVSDHGGEVISFAGDAILAVWPGEDTLAAAARCALELAARDADVAEGVDARLQVRLAVGAGPLTGLQVGRPSHQVYYCLMGRPLERVAEAIAHADAGEVALSATDWEPLRAEATGRACSDGTQILIGLAPTGRFERRAEPPAPPDDVLAPYVARAVLAREAAWVGEMRRVTAIFVDLPDLVDGTEPAAVQELVVALQADLERHGAQLNELGVDNHGARLVAATGLPPRAHDNDPERGVRTAQAIAQTLRRLGWRGSIGVTTGRALCGLVGNERRREYTVLGDFVNVAARLSTSGDASQLSVLCDAATAQATGRRIEYAAPLELTVKGKSRPISAFRPLGRRAPSAVGGAAAGLGRSDERGTLTAAIEAAAGGANRAVVLVGEPGLGKSHLLAEATALAAERGLRCVYGAGDAVEQATAYHPWRPVFEALLGPAGADAVGARAPLLNPVLGVDLPNTPETAAIQGEGRVRATRELAVELLAAEPLCIAIDDAHWMDSASWGLTRDVVRQARPGLVLLAMRPVDAPAPECAQLLAEPGAARLDLGSLADADALDLAAERLGAEWLDAPVADLILERAGGNPLFVEEIARALADAGLVSVDRAGTCVVTRGADLRRLALPDTVEGVIASRMDGLTAPVDLTLKVSSVVGPTFLARLVRDVHPVERVAARVDATLETLVARELTQPASATAYSFRHALIRDVAYERLLFGQRRALHRAIGALMAGRTVESLATLPPATDPARAAAIGTLLQTAPAAFISRQSELFALIGLQAFRLSLESGATPYLPGVLSLYALITRSLEVDPRPAFALSSLAERLAKRDSPALLANAAFVHSWFVHHWLEPIADILPRIPAWADAGFEHGDVTMGCFNVAGYVTLLAAGGAPLDDVIAAGAAGLERIAGRTASAVFHCRHEMQIAKALAGRTVQPCSLTDADTDEERDLAAVRDTDMVNQYAYYLSSKLRLHFYFGEPAAALGYGDQAEPLLDAFAGQQQEAEFVFFHGLALLAHARETGDARALARGEAAVERMRAWAAYAPAVFGGRVAIMEGQLAWARGERELAVERFAEGAADADPHHAALAHELAGRCLGDSEHLRAAIAGYRAWGAAAKVSDVEAALG